MLIPTSVNPIEIQSLKQLREMGCCDKSGWLIRTICCNFKRLYNNCNVPQRNDIIRNINQIQNWHQPKNPRSLQDLQIEAPYSRTLNGVRVRMIDRS